MKPPLPPVLARTLAVLLLSGCALGLHAGDCSGPDDCGAIPDNATKAACGGAIIAGYCFITRSRKKDPETIEGEGDATEMDDAFGASGSGGGTPGGGTAPAGGGSPGRGGPPDGPLGDPGDLPPAR